MCVGSESILHEGASGCAARTDKGRTPQWVSERFHQIRNAQRMESERAEGDVVIIIIEYIPVAVRALSTKGGWKRRTGRVEMQYLPLMYTHSMLLSVCVCRSQYCTRLIHVCNPRQGQSRHPAAHSITRDIRVAQPAASILITRAHKKLFAHFLHLSASISGLLFAPSNFSTPGLLCGMRES